MAQVVRGKVARVAGPLVVAKEMNGVKMFEVVRVGSLGLFGEVIRVEGDRAYIQVYEETGGVKPGEEVVGTGELLSVELGPGLVKNIYDGIQRPLEVLWKMGGSFLVRGVEAPSLDRNKKWHFEPKVKVGDEVSEGDVLGEVPETSTVVHKIMVPPGIRGKVIDIRSGDFTVEEVVAVIDTGKEKKEIKMYQKWPVRMGRPYRKKIAASEPMITGQRTIDTFFPIVKGGTAAVPGPFGSGKTVIQHQLARWSDADVVVYIGCGERGNEMTDVLIEFPELKDPRTGGPLMDRTVLIANTSNMPVAAREASVFTGIAIAEYFRDMGYNVALMADSTSRWAEAMREISGRLEEMPGEEGYPAYLASRISSFYERAGMVEALGSPERTGSVSVIGAVSPPGGDLSDPVVQATLREVRVFWSLDQQLAFARHFPAIHWLRSYSLYVDRIGEWAKEHVALDWADNRNEAMKILQQESELQELVRLVGYDALSPHDQLLLETARSLREDFLQQDAFDDIDTYCPLQKQYHMLRNVLHFHHKAEEALQAGVSVKDIVSLPIREKISRMRFIPPDRLDEIKAIYDEIDAAFENLMKKGGEAQ